MPGYSQDDFVRWLTGQADGRLDLTEDNPGLAAAAIGLLQPPPLEPPETLPDGYLSPHFSLADGRRGRVRRPVLSS